MKMNMMQVLLLAGTAAVLSACASSSEPQKPSREQVQSECRQHYASVSDEFERNGKIKECVRKRGAL